jgi:hypothetical protein
MTIYSIYEKNHPVIPKQVVIVVDLGYLGVEKNSRTIIHIIVQKEKKPRFITRRKRV